MLVDFSGCCVVAVSECGADEACVERVMDKVMQEGQLPEVSAVVLFVISLVLC